MKALRRLMGQRRPGDIDPGMSGLSSALEGADRATLLGRGRKRAPKRFMIRTFGKKGTKILTSVPVIGGIADFAINLAFGEPPGRAAGKAVFAGLGAVVVRSLVNFIYLYRTFCYFFSANTSRTWRSWWWINW